MSRTSRMGALSQRFDRLSLRLRLTLAIVLLTGAGLLLAGAVTYHYLDAFLMRRVDQQVDGLQSTAQRLVRGGLHGPGFGDQLSLPNGSWVQAYAPDGTLA